MDTQSGKFKVAIQKPRQIQQGGGSQFNLADSYELEREALDPIGAEIVEIDPETDEELIEAAKDSDAVIARGRRISAEIIAALEKCVVICLLYTSPSPRDGLLSRMPSSA